MPYYHGLGQIPATRHVQSAGPMVRSTPTGLLDLQRSNSKKSVEVGPTNPSVPKTSSIICRRGSKSPRQSLYIDSYYKLGQIPTKRPIQCCRQAGKVSADAQQDSGGRIRLIE